MQFFSIEPQGSPRKEENNPSVNSVFSVARNEEATEFTEEGREQSLCELCVLCGKK
jgi:hypothetical protein